MPFDQTSKAGPGSKTESLNVGAMREMPVVREAQSLEGRYLLRKETLFSGLGVGDGHCATIRVKNMQFSLFP